jgi:hypothetical protein
MKVVLLLRNEKCTPIILRLSKKKINNMLSKATKTALKAIAERNYHDTVKFKAKEIIELGLAISGYGSQVKAASAMQGQRPAHGRNGA